MVSFNDLSQQSDDMAPGQAPPAPTGGAMSNDASTEAILTSPYHQARTQTEMSKQRLQRLAMQLKATRNVV